MRPNAPLWFLNSNVSQGKQGLSGRSPRKWNGLDPAPFKGGGGGWGGGGAGGADKDRTFQVEGTNGWSTHT